MIAAVATQRGRGKSAKSLELIEWDVWNRCIRVEEAQRDSLYEVIGAWKAAAR